MFERLQKPFLTVETGEAYQPIRLTYKLTQKDQLLTIIKHIKCCEQNGTATTWNWFWRDECDDLHFESLDSYQRNPQHPQRLGTLMIKDDALYINLPSFKRACLAIPFFHKLIDPAFAQIDRADFINKVFGLDERLPHGFSEMFKDDELEKIVHQRVSDYEKVQMKCEHASTPEEALAILSEYTKIEASKRLPYAERYIFKDVDTDKADVVFLSFYIYLRSRELVAIKRWFGNTGYTLSDATDETVEQVFGGMNIDILE